MGSIFPWSLYGLKRLPSSSCLCNGFPLAQWFANIFAVSWRTVVTFQFWMCKTGTRVLEELYSFSNLLFYFPMKEIWFTLLAQHRSRHQASVSLMASFTIWKFKESSRIMPSSGNCNWSCRHLGGIYFISRCLLYSFLCMLLARFNPMYNLDMNMCIWWIVVFTSPSLRFKCL